MPYIFSQMDDTSRKSQASESVESDQGSKTQYQHKVGRTDGAGCGQTLYVLIFRGIPRDSASARVVDFCIVDHDGDYADTTFHLKGERGSYGLTVTSNLGTIHSRPHFVRQFHVATVSKSSFDDNRLHELVTSIHINNENPEWTRWTWVDNVLSAVSAAGFITSEEGTEVLDATIDCVSDAPYPD